MIYFYNTYYNIEFISNFKKNKLILINYNNYFKIYIYKYFLYNIFILIFY